MPTKKPTLKSLKRQLALANDALEAALALSPERDNNFFSGGLSSLYNNRSSWDRKKIFAEALRAWRVNPIARRIVTLIRSFVIGKGLAITVKARKKNIMERVFKRGSDRHTEEFLQAWWNHPLNNFRKNIKRWKDEDTRTGNLFLLFAVDQSGMSYIRAVPSEQISEIKTKENDIEQETSYTVDAIGEEGWTAFDAASEQTEFMLHFAANQPVGCPWGEADFNTLLVWIGRFSSWLEDRVRLNRFRSAIMYAITGRYNSEAERRARERTLNANPPRPGSVLVLNRDNGETWEVISPKLDSTDANADGLAIKKNILSGVGHPLHYYAEPESATRTTAEAAGTPTFRTLEEAQSDFFNTLMNVARVALQIRARVDRKINPNVELEIKGPDITERDNATLALALARSYPALADLFDRNLIDENILLDLTFRMIAEPFDGNAPKGLRKNIKAASAPAAPKDNTVEPTDPKGER
jgi:hypothetical protein